MVMPKNYLIIIVSLAVSLKEHEDEDVSEDEYVDGDEHDEGVHVVEGGNQRALAYGYHLAP